MHQISLNRKEEILMRSAQSRLGVVTSLGSARRGVGRCVEALPVPVSALKVGGAAFAGLAGALVMRGLFSSGKKKKAAAAAAAAPSPASRGMAALLSEIAMTLLLPLCRRYFLGDGAAVSAKPAGRLSGGGE